MRLRNKWSIEILFTWRNEITDGRRMRWICEKQTMGDRKGCIEQIQNLKKNTNQLTNEERTKNDEEWFRNRSRLRFRSALASFFFFFLLLLLNLTKSFQCWKSEPLPSAPSRLFIGNEGTWLISSLPRWASYFILKSFRGPGEPKASLGEPGIRKSFQMTLLSSLWEFSVFFCETSKNLSNCTTTGVKLLNSASKDQKINKR